MDRSTLQNKLNQPYTTDNWREIVQHVFPNVQIFSPPQTIPVNNDKVETFCQLGNVTLQDGKTLALFELKLKSNVNILRNRVELNTIVSQYIDQERTHGVLSIFEQGTDDYRFTFSARATEYDEESGDFNTKKTDTKRYTYVLGRNESCKTPATRFAELADKKAQANIQSIQDAFSVEKLSKEFFKEYKVHYQKMVDYLLATDTYKRVIFNGDEKAVRDFVKLLMGRLVFIHFVQKKRWMGVPADIAGWHDGPVNFLYQGFLDFEYKETFYSAFLEPLFYDTLNTPNRPGDLFSVTGTKVPYLNGGLFEQGDTDTSLINFPEAYFADLLEFFDRYNFTIDENDLSEKEIGIDPEMLGHIFENLLEDNKDKGAFYTPKEIVHYMCQESLKEYLKTQLESHGVWPSEMDQANALEQSLEAFVKRKEAAGVIDHDGILAKALRDVKICDPAIGSGAFPMGLLTEIFRCMYVLYYASPDTVGEIWDMDEWQPEKVKLNIIQNSIYGVDIEKGAVDIARLRFWLSLIVDEPEPHALPNLDYKIVVGNSLVSKLDDEIIDIDWEIKNGTQSNAFGIANVERRKTLLQSISTHQKAYFDPTCDKETVGHTIRDLKIDLLINQLEEMINTQGVESQPTGTGRAITQQTERYLQTLGWKQSIRNLGAIKVDCEAHLHFFDWKLDFPEVMNGQVTETVGFDIVIGNPPYFNVQLLGQKSPYIENIKNKYSEIWMDKSDILFYFIKMGIDLTKKSGCTNYIISNAFLFSDKAKKLRNYILDNAPIESIINFEKYSVFESAMITTAIVLFKKDKSNSIASSLTLKEGIKNNFQSIVHDKKNYISVVLNYNSVFALINNKTEILNTKIDSNKIPLGQLLLVGKGMETAANEIFSNDNLMVLGFPSMFLKKRLNGKAIRKYKIDESFVDNILYFEQIETFDQLHVTIQDYLKSNEVILKNRATVKNEGRIWWRYSRPMHKDYYNLNKIWTSYRSGYNCFAYDDTKNYIGLTNTTVIFDTNPNVVDLKFVLALLNSKLLNYRYKSIGKQTGGGIFEYFENGISKLPIAVIQKKEQLPFVKLIEQILNNTNSNDTSDIEEELDNLIYKLYELTYDEVLVVEPEFGDRMSRDEYEALVIE